MVRQAGFKNQCPCDMRVRVPLLVHMNDKCELCGSVDDYLNFHHLIPRTLHSKKYFKNRYEKSYLKKNGIWICKSHCHLQIHRFISEKEMGLKYNTLDLLLSHVEVNKYVKWRIKKINKNAVS